MKSLQASAKPRSMWPLCAVAMCALVMILFSASGMAQSALGSGRLEGTVVDPSGAVLADATVTARNQATGVSETTKCGADGHFRASITPSICGRQVDHPRGARSRQRLRAAVCLSRVLVCARV